MVVLKRTCAGLLVAVLLAAAPAPAYAQQTTEEIIALLEQILKLTQLVLALQAQIEALEAASATPTVVTPPTTSAQSSSEILRLPVHIHLVQSSESVLQTQTQASDIPRVLALVNTQYWKQANIEWTLGSVGVHTITNGSDADYTSAVARNSEQEATSQLGRFIEGATLQPGFNVFVVHNLGDISSNGQYFETTGVTIVSETNGRESGDSYISYLIAHELGHALGLPHEGGFTNLMHAGQRENTVPRSERTALTSEQVRTAREHARIGTPYNGSTH